MTERFITQTGHLFKVRNCAVPNVKSVTVNAGSVAITIVCNAKEECNGFVAPQNFNNLVAIQLAIENSCCLVFVVRIGCNFHVVIINLRCPCSKHNFSVDDVRFPFVVRRKCSDNTCYDVRMHTVLFTQSNANLVGVVIPLHSNLPIVGVALKVGCQDGIGVCHGGVGCRWDNHTAWGDPGKGLTDQRCLWFNLHKKRGHFCPRFYHFQRPSALRRFTRMLASCPQSSHAAAYLISERREYCSGFL